MNPLQPCPAQLDCIDGTLITCGARPQFFIRSDHTLVIFCPDCARNGRDTRVSVTSTLPRFRFTQALENLWNSLGECVGPEPEKSK